MLLPVTTSLANTLTHSHTHTHTDTHTYTHTHTDRYADGISPGLLLCALYGSGLKSCCAFMYSMWINWWLKQLCVHVQACVWQLYATKISQPPSEDLVSREQWTEAALCVYVCGLKIDFIYSPCTAGSWTSWHFHCGAALYRKRQTSEPVCQCCRQALSNTANKDSRRFIPVIDSVTYRRICSVVSCPGL